MCCSVQISYVGAVDLKGRGGTMRLCYGKRGQEIQKNPKVGVWWVEWSVSRGEGCYCSEVQRGASILADKVCMLLMSLPSSGTHLC